MANESLIQFAAGVLVADCLADASSGDDIELTQYPIEDGSSISDHAIVKPRTLDLTLVQTETPIVAAGFRTQSVDLSTSQRPAATQQGRADVAQARVQLTLQGLSGAAISALGGGPPKEIRWTGQKTDSPAAVKQFRVSVLQADQPVARVNDFHNALLSLQANTELLVVTVKGQTWTDMILTSVKRTDPQGQAGCARFTCSLQQVRTVETQTVELPPVPKATSKKSVGKVATETPAEATERKKTEALQFVQGFGLLRR